VAGAPALALAALLVMVTGCGSAPDPGARPASTAGGAGPVGASDSAGSAAADSPTTDAGAAGGPTSTPASPATISTLPPTADPAIGPTLTEDGRATTVVAVVDGDTIEVEAGERVRLIGIDTPETKDPRRPVGCFGAEASARTAALLAPGTPVRLVGDVEPTDRYGRTLAYVVRAEDDLFVNLALVAEGYALVATYPPNVAHVDELVAAQARARDAGLGLWSACPGPDAPATTTTAPAGDGAPGEPSGGATCSSSYPTLCLPPAPDLDCGDLAERRFPVLPPDPHRLDGNGDGVGCES
jgi:micrococcal nuclease